MPGPALSRRSLVSGPDALDVRPRPLSVPGPSALCVGARRSRSALCVGARRSLCRAQHSAGALCAGPLAHLCRAPPPPRVIQPRAPTPTSHPRATDTVPGPQLRLRALSSDPRTTQSIRGPPVQISVPPIQPGAFPFSRSLGENSNKNNNNNK